MISAPVKSRQMRARLPESSLAAPANVADVVMVPPPNRSGQVGRRNNISAARNGTQKSPSEIFIRGTN